MLDERVSGLAPCPRGRVTFIPSQGWDEPSLASAFEATARSSPAPMPIRDVMETSDTAEPGPVATMTPPSATIASPNGIMNRICFPAVYLPQLSAPQ